LLERIDQKLFGIRDILLAINIFSNQTLYILAKLARKLSWIDSAFSPATDTIGYRDDLISHSEGVFTALVDLCWMWLFAQARVKLVYPFT